VLFMRVILGIRSKERYRFAPVCPPDAYATLASETVCLPLHRHPHPAAVMATSSGHCLAREGFGIGQ